MVGVLETVGTGVVWETETGRGAWETETVYTGAYETVVALKQSVASSCWSKFSW